MTVTIVVKIEKSMLSSPDGHFVIFNLNHLVLYGMSSLLLFFLKICTSRWDFSLFLNLIVCLKFDNNKFNLLY